MDARRHQTGVEGKENILTHRLIGSMLYQRLIFVIGESSISTFYVIKALMVYNINNCCIKVV